MLKSHVQLSIPRHPSTVHRHDTMTRVAAHTALDGGTQVHGYVTGVSAKAGAFVVLRSRHVAHVKKSQLAEGYVVDPAAEFPVGKHVRGHVTSVEGSRCPPPPPPPFPFPSAGTAQEPHREGRRPGRPAHLLRCQVARCRQRCPPAECDRLPCRSSPAAASGVVGVGVGWAQGGGQPAGRQEGRRGRLRLRRCGSVRGGDTGGRGAAGRRAPRRGLWRFC